MAAKLNLLTDIACKNATSEGRAIRKLHDGGGLYLWVYLDGRKYWRLRYKVAGVEKSLSLGVYPEVGLKKARAARQEQAALLEARLDPGAERRARKVREKIAAENSFQAVAEDWFKKQLNTWSQGYAEDVHRRLEVNLYGEIGRRPIAQIEAPELLAAVQKIEDRGSYDLAHRVLQVSGQVFRFGIATGRCTRDISQDLRGALTPHKPRHQAAVRPEELPTLLRAIATYETIGDRQTMLALRLMSMTFVRTIELIGAKWSEFDLEAALWAVPAERMKMKTEHLVPLRVRKSLRW